MFKSKLSILVSLALPLFAVAAETATPGPEILKVVSSVDDGSEGTLRWALTKNNENPGHYRIEIDLKNSSDLVIKPRTELPPIKGPVDIINLNWLRKGEYVAIDGSAYIKPGDPKACPGAVPGQYGANVRTTSLPGLVLRDTHDVTLQGLEIRNFCIGILINRASNNVIEDSRIVANHGGAGLMMTGDDGKGNSTATTTQRNKIIRNQFINNGDGMEATRGASFNLIADNLVTTDETTNQEPSQGLEMLWGNDNEVIHNHFQNYSDGVQLNWGNRNYIAANTFNNLSSAVTLSGTGNIVSGNRMIGNRVAVSVRPQGEPGKDGTFGINRITGPAIDRISENIMIGNGKDIKRCFAGGSCLPGYAGAIVYNVPGLEHAAFIGNRGGGVSNDTTNLEKICAIDGQSVGCEPTPNKNQQPPVIEHVSRHNNELSVTGEVKGEAGTVYRVEFFSNSKPSMDESENYLGFEMVPVDESGIGAFHYSTSVPASLRIANVTSTATTNDGATSPLSSPAAAR
ncbi:NosD domain-containing protein [Paraburkholderia sp. Ac-20347]|uniref:NosD domain-containing protein n=1 Tax=Paraburkholderia sp. Ac-20347 TaxID=2703892 RepID=UPI0019818EB4|nr:NosD domain-containing protein [Paraburkholderia sp. Ac-20347]MBN3809077.1 3-dehydroshikimate dehydratase [Paraburkholderia sp. Ac-20347]